MTELEKRERNNPKFKELRRSLRDNLTAPESILWSKLKSKQSGAKFRRQYGIKNYILDFYCPALHLAIEIDGNSHYSNEALVSDKARDEYLLFKGIKTLRFTNEDITCNIDGVMCKLLEEVQ